jgi:FAD/FMN-containing dehydrogenase
MRQSLHTLLRMQRAAALEVAIPALDWKFPPKKAAELQKRVRGSVILPGDKIYHEARQAFIPNFQKFPQIIVVCSVFADVAEALAFARTWKLIPVCRAGGHSTAGYCVNDGLVIDVSRLAYVVVDDAKETAVVGAGTNFGQLNATLDSFGLHLVGGACDDVAVAGYMQGGGYGYTSMIYGMNSDNVLAVRVMLADGSIVSASRKHHPDLFWAIRGGTGGNFGVLLEVTYQLQRMGEVWGFGIKWKAKHAATALEVLQRDFTGRAAPAGLGHQSTLNYDGGKLCLFLRGVYAGTRADGRKVTSALARLQGAEVDVDVTGSYAHVNQVLNESPLVPNVPPRTRTEADSRYVERTLTAPEWESLIAHMRNAPNQSNFVGLEGYGGKIRSIAANASAFVHRRASFNVYSWVFWQNAQDERASLMHLEAFRRVLSPYANGHAYQNYPNPGNADFRRMYWGKNFERLLRIKKQYDPDGLFVFDQCVSPEP